MDPRRFDTMARSLAAPKTRRGLLGSLAALAAGLLGAHATEAQVSQAHCGNKTCASNPGICNDGCVCCVYPNGNSRCRPPGTCSPGTTVCPLGEVGDSVAGCVTTTTTTTAPPCPPGQASCGGGCIDTMSDEANCGACGVACAAGGACLDGDCFLAVPNCPGSFALAANGGGVNACICGFGSFAGCDTTGDCADGEVCILVRTSPAGFAGQCFAGCSASAG